MKLFKLFLPLALLTLPIWALAQMPILKTGTTTEQPVTLKKLDINVQLVGNIATTTMTMTFYNSSNRVLEGELTFPMPEGVTISRYALDINGKMREAVPVEKAKATEVFESIVRRRVDPGLLEKVEGNNFRTKIYPIPANGSRTIALAYEEELKLGANSTLRYHLPLAYPEKIAEFSLNATIFESVAKPEFVEQPDGSLDIKNMDNTYIASLKKTDFISKQGLSINLPKKANLPEVQMQKASSGYYFLVNVFPKSASRPHQWSNEIGLIWDCSLSGLQRDLKKEMELLDLIVKQRRNLVIRLGLLNNTFNEAGTFTITNGNWDALKDRLNKIVYDGGTDFSRINGKVLPAGEYLFFTDGLSTFGKNTVALQQPVHVVNSSLKADYSTQKYIALKSGGKFVNLNATNAKEAFEQLNEDQLQYLGIKNNTEVRQTYPSLPVSAGGHLAVAGILSEYSTKIILQFGYGNTVVSEQEVRLDPNTQPLSRVEVSRIWAQKKIAEMDIQYETNKDEISSLSKQFGIVTRNTSLLVLETLDDYLRYDITPPAELRKEFDLAIKQRGQSILERRTDLINAAIAMSKTLKEWWNTDFTPKSKQEQFKFPQPVVVVAEERVREAAANPPSPARNERQRAESAQSSERLQSANSLQEVVIVAGGNAQAKRSTTYAASSVTIPANAALQGKVAGLEVTKDKSQAFEQQPIITVKEFKSDKDYMKSLTGKPEEAYQKYLVLREQYLHTPTFYFDVANWFYQQADSVRALKILSNMAELELENADLYKVMAYKLKQTHNYAASLFIAEKVLQWRPMDAQSYRDYALALEDMGRYQEALNNLYKVLTQSYNTQSASRDRGIEEIIIAEINHLITKYGKRLDTKQIDKKLIQPLPVDIRVVLNWNKNDTDIDLWVTDPDGEKCYYSHPKTEIGGRMSNDFTSGYGPEQFMLKKAIKGKYKIEVNYFGDRQVSISGPTTVSAEIYIRYATGKEERKMMVLPLEARNRGGNLVGEFSF
ncbi:VIT domain-containing protein [Pedobacter sp. KR3-3]|uniref:VIT domain-containing protein n=1 Tax=Pedobacter albus TaxID=3113905 RepID=A0ABU7ICV1_9SPHI|nr:VIT domain-containing protein [Pedobacter sp. KR3-3]MEE1947294.1 VIT domain-containing protein [Pedobacter sp. KR3-3]